MRHQLRRRIRCGVLAAFCLGAVAAHLPPVHAGGLLVPLAQAGPAPAPAKEGLGAPLPSNTTVSGRMYVVEGIVVVLLFAGAVFAVCRSSQRT